MEIQSFILCKSIQTSGGIFDGHIIGIHSLFPLEGGYPLTAELQHFTLLRRDRRAYDEQFSIRFDLVDMDGRPAGEPAGFRHKATFPANAKFYQFYGGITLVFPAPGDYRLDITADEEGNPFLYAYNIEATEKTG